MKARLPRRLEWSKIAGLGFYEERISLMNVCFQHKKFCTNNNCSGVTILITRWQTVRLAAETSGIVPGETQEPITWMALKGKYVKCKSEPGPQLAGFILFILFFLNKQIRQQTILWRVAMMVVTLYISIIYSSLSPFPFKFISMRMLILFREVGT